MSPFATVTSWKQILNVLPTKISFEGRKFGSTNRNLTFELNTAVVRQPFRSSPARESQLSAPAEKEASFMLELLDNPEEKRYFHKLVFLKKQGS